VWAALVVLSHPLFEKSPQVSLIERDQEIQTLQSKGSDKAFAESVRLRRSKRRFQDAQAHQLCGRIELGLIFPALID
jgi:hypothetical protein